MEMLTLFMRRRARTSRVLESSRRRPLSMISMVTFWSGTPKRAARAGEDVSEVGEAEGLLAVSGDEEAERGGELVGGFEDAHVYAAHEDDADFAMLFGYLAEELDAVDAGDHEVEEDEGGVGGE